MKTISEMNVVEARSEVERLRALVASNHYQAPERVPQLTLKVRSKGIQLKLAQMGVLASTAILASGVWLAVEIHSAWVLLAILGLLCVAVSGFAAYRASARLADLRRLLDGWREALIRVEAEKHVDQLEELDVYRIRTLDIVDELRYKANRNRRMHNILQILIIVGSITITSFTSIGTDEPIMRWASVAVAASVSVAAGVSSFFKYRERSQNEQRTADAIEKELHHLQLGVGVYSGKRAVALKLFAVTVEGLREEQRKAELQLDQTSVAESSRMGQNTPT